jgi:hypothetical protein
MVREAQVKILTGLSETQRHEFLTLARTVVEAASDTGKPDRSV